MIRLFWKSRFKNLTNRKKENGIYPSPCADVYKRQETDLLIDTYHVRHLVFDFTETEFMDSSGIGVIIGRCKNLGYSGGDVSACHLNERVDKIFTVSGLKKIIQVKE